MHATANVPAVTRAPWHIPIAGFKDVYDVDAVDRALAELPQGASDALKSTYEKMLKAGGTRLSVKPSGLPAMEHLFDELPNFGAVLEDIRKQIALCASSADALELTPMLLLGDPGVLVGQHLLDRLDEHGDQAGVAHAEVAGLRIDVKKSDEFEGKIEAPAAEGGEAKPAESARSVKLAGAIEQAVENLSRIPGVGKKVAQSLVEAGFTSLDGLVEADPKDLCNLPGIGERTAEKIVENAKKLKEEKEE